MRLYEAVLTVLGSKGVEAEYVWISGGVVWGEV